MSETSLTNHEVDTENKPTFRAEWFQEYIKASALYPLVTFGRAIFVGSSVMQHPPKQLSDFGSCELSDEQAEEFIKVMTIAHQVADIDGPRYDANRAKSFWYPYRDTIQTYFDRLSGHAPVQSMTPDLDTRDKRLKYLFANPESSEFDFVLEILKRAQTALTSPDALKISKQVRDNYSNIESHRNADLTPKLQSIVKSNLLYLDQQSSGLTNSVLADLQIAL